MNKISSIVCLCFATVLMGCSDDAVTSNVASIEFKSQRYKIKEAIVVDVRGAAKETRLQIVSIQGIVNRQRPTIFILDENSNEERWQKLLEKHFGIRFISKRPEDLVREYAPKIGKQVLYNLSENHSVNTATTIAGLESAILTTTDLGVQTVFDARGKWSSLVDAYKWASANLMSRVEKREIGYTEEDGVGVRDYAISNKLFNMQLDAINNSEQINLFKDILSKFPSMTPLLGYPSPSFADQSKGQNAVTAEVAAVELISKSGKVMIPSDGARNLSFLSGLAPRGGLRQSLPGDIQYDSKKRYVSLIVSDGDNIQYVINRMREIWETRQKYSTPLGWTIAPTTSRYAPIVLDVYYKEAAEKKRDEFIAGPSGYGYVYPSLYNDSQMREFAKKTREANIYSDLRSIFVLDKENASSNDTKRLVSAFEKEGETAVWLRKRDNTSIGFNTQGKLSYITGKYAWKRDLGDAVSAVAESARQQPFSMVYLDVWNFDMDDLDKIRSKVDKNIVFVLPSQLMNLARKNRGLSATPNMPNPPGTPSPITVETIVDPAPPAPPPPQPSAPPAPSTPPPTPQECKRTVTKEFTDGIGILINSRNYPTGSTDGQCNTSCHRAGYIECIGSCKVPGTVNDSQCRTCKYTKEVEEVYPCN